LGGEPNSQNPHKTKNEQGFARTPNRWVTKNGQKALSIHKPTWSKLHTNRYRHMTIFRALGKWPQSHGRVVEPVGGRYCGHQRKAGTLLAALNKAEPKSLSRLSSS
jgi:hypothetical protein